MVTQTWIVLALFVLSIIFTFIMTIISPYYRMLMFNSDKTQIAFYIMYVLIVAVLMMYGTECSVIGQQKLAACSGFAWILVAFVFISFIAHLGYGIYAHVVLKRNDDKSKTVATK